MTADSQFMRNLIAAHVAAGAPGDVIGFGGDGTYTVRLRSHCSTKATRKYRMRTHGTPDRVTVICNWSIAGQRQRKQATV